MSIERWGWYSVGVNVLLIAINLTVALASGNLAVAAEMVHNMADFVAALAVLLGLRLSSRKSAAFPYGLYKLENIIAIVLAGTIFFTAYEIAKDALTAAEGMGAVSLWMLVAVTLAGAIPLIFSRYELKAGRAANSPALIADAQEYRVHGLTAAVALLALIGQRANLALDRIGALLIVVVIAKTGWDLLIGGVRVLLDASLPPETLDQVREIILSEPAVAQLNWVTGRNAGRFRFIEAEIALRVQDLAKAEAVTQRIEARIREAVPFVERVLLHAEPVPRTHIKYAIPLADTRGTISPHFGEAPFFAFLTVRVADNAVEQQTILANPNTGQERAKGIQVAEWLVGQKVDIVLLRESLQGKGPAYVFRDAGIELKLIQSETVAQALVENPSGISIEAAQGQNTEASPHDNPDDGPEERYERGPARLA